MQLISTARLWQRQRRPAPRAGSAPPPTLRLSENHVVGLSLNVALVGSCRPTKLCREKCYALRGLVAFQASRDLQAENLARLEYLEAAPLSEVRAEADGIAAQVRSAGQDVLRINGTGDLVPGTVRLLNVLSRRHPWLRLWVATRKLALARQIILRQNVHVMLSADRTTCPADITTMLELRRRGRGRVFLSWLRDDLSPVPSEVDLLFHEHHGAWKAPLPAEPPTCPKTIVGTESKLACLSCRWCFDRRESGEPPNA